MKCGRGAFGYCQNLGTLNISEGVTEIADSCFMGNSILILDVPASVTRIGQWAFGGSKIFRLKFHAPSFVICENAISSSYIEPVEGLEGCTSIGSWGLRGLTGTFTVNPNTTYADNAVIGDFDKIIIPAAAADYNPQGVTSAKYYQVESGHTGQLRLFRLRQCLPLLRKPAARDAWRGDYLAVDKYLRGLHRA